MQALRIHLFGANVFDHNRHDIASNGLPGAHYTAVYNLVIRATGTDWQVSEGGTSPWRRLFTTRQQLSSAAFGDFEGDSHTDAFFADGKQWTIVQSFSPLVRRHYVQVPAYIT